MVLISLISSHSSAHLVLHIYSLFLPKQEFSSATYLHSVSAKQVSITVENIFSAFASVKSEAESHRFILLVHCLLLKIDHVESFIAMNNQIIFISRILSVTLLLPPIPTEFLTLASPNAFGQQMMFDSIDKDNGSSASDTTNDDNITDHNIVAISTTTGTNESSAAPFSNMNQTIAMIAVVDVINSTYIVPKEVDEDESERRISRAIRDRINDILHTVVRSNATIISTATITNSIVNESTTINNHTRLLEIIPDQVEVALAGIRAVSQPANALLELHTDIETVCSANNTALADCNINLRIR
jgi:hypothetical protein